MIKMKILPYLLMVLLMVSCSSKNSELYEITDSFVESMDAGSEKYGMFDGGSNQQTTSDEEYRVMPIGKLINVKIMKPVEKEVYVALKEDLEEHYIADPRVKKVYISNAGTIMIDCRN